jgi:hypothetical protein
MWAIGYELPKYVSKNLILGYMSWPSSTSRGSCKPMMRRRA